MSGAAQAGRCHPVIAAGTQALRQPGQRVDLGPDFAGPAAAVAGQFARGPGLRGPGQPRLADAGERQPPAVAEDGQVPDVAVLLGGGIGQAAADVAGQGGQQRPGRRPARTAAGGQSAIDADCRRRSVSQTPRRFTSVIFAPLRVRCQIPNSTCTATSGASPRRLTCPLSDTAARSAPSAAGRSAGRR